jgi:hypothetical protein
MTTIPKLDLTPIVTAIEKGSELNCIEIAGVVFTGVAALVAAYSAIVASKAVKEATNATREAALGNSIAEQGLNEWKNELLARRDNDLAVRIVLAVHALTDAICTFRSYPAITIREIQKAENMGQVFLDDPARDKKYSDKVFALLEDVQSYQKKVSTLIVEAQLYWGPQPLDLVWPIVEVVTKITSEYNSVLARNNSAPGLRTTDTNDILIANLEPSRDSFWQTIMSSKRNIISGLKPYLLYEEVASSLASEEDLDQ